MASNVVLFNLTCTPALATPNHGVPLNAPVQFSSHFECEGDGYSWIPLDPEAASQFEKNPLAPESGGLHGLCACVRGCMVGRKLFHFKKPWWR